MKLFDRFARVLIAALMLAALEGCKSSDTGASGVSAGVYDDPFLDMWYYGDYCDEGEIIVTPPDRPTDPPKPTHPIVLPPDAPAKPTHPIAPTPTPRPTPMPSIPRMPMPRVRAR